jgi:hypothetical protein
MQEEKLWILIIKALVYNIIVVIPIIFQRELKKKIMNTK